MRVCKREFTWSNENKNCMRVEKREFTWEFRQLSCPDQTRTRVVWELRSESLHESFINSHVLIKREQELYESWQARVYLRVSSWFSENGKGWDLVWTIGYMHLCQRALRLRANYANDAHDRIFELVWTDAVWLVFQEPYLKTDSSSQSFRDQSGATKRQLTDFWNWVRVDRTGENQSAARWTEESGINEKIAKREQFSPSFESFDSLSFIPNHVATHCVFIDVRDFLTAIQ